MVQIHSPRLFFSCGHLRRSVRKAFCKWDKTYPETSLVFSTGANDSFMDELFLANVIWISANLSPDCLQDLGQFSQPNRFSHRIEREAFMAWINNKPLLWLEVCAGEMKALL